MELDLVLEAAGMASKVLLLIFPEEIALLLTETGGFGECLEIFKQPMVLLLRKILRK